MAVEFPFTGLFREQGALADVEVLEASLADHRLDRPDVLAPAELGGCLRIRGAVERSRALRSRAGLRLLLGRRLAVAPAAVRLVAGPWGKPTLDASHCSRLRFNLSHSGDRLLVALGTGREVGIDIEAGSDGLDVDAIAGLAMAEHERRTLRRLALPARRAAFLRLWTRKEALLKATGEGLMREPRTAALPRHLCGRWADGRVEMTGRTWRLVDLPAEPPGAAALAVELG
jgi:4'-phosphopantetheinyl transferase